MDITRNSKRKLWHKQDVGVRDEMKEKVWKVTPIHTWKQVLQFSNASFICYICNKRFPLKVLFQLVGRFFTHVFDASHQLFALNTAKKKTRSFSLLTTKTNKSYFASFKDKRTTSSSVVIGSRINYSPFESLFCKFVIIPARGYIMTLLSLGVNYLISVICLILYKTFSRF